MYSVLLKLEQFLMPRRRLNKYSVYMDRLPRGLHTSTVKQLTQPANNLEPLAILILYIPSIISPESASGATISLQNSVWR